MNLNVVTIQVSEDNRVLRCAIIKDIQLTYPADIAQAIILRGFPSELSIVNWNEMPKFIKKNESFKSSCVMHNGNDLYLGVSAYSMYAAIGAAALQEFEELEAIES